VVIVGFIFCIKRSCSFIKKTREKGIEAIFIKHENIFIILIVSLTNHLMAFFINEKGVFFFTLTTAFTVCFFSYKSIASKTKFKVLLLDAMNLKECIGGNS
jgi:hypothetical protein